MGFGIVTVSGERLCRAMTRKPAPVSTSLPDWAHRDSVGGNVAVAVVAGGRGVALLTVAEAAVIPKAPRPDSLGISSDLLL